MRSLVAFACATLLLYGTAASAGVTLPLEPMRAEQEAALEKAVSLTEAMEAGVQRHQAATFIFYRLMMRGDCSRALPIMKRELQNVSDFKAIGGLITGALTGRDPRCLTWVADRTNVLLQAEPFSEEQRAELRVKGRTMYQLAGWLGRAARMPLADLDTLDVVPKSLSHRTFALEGLTMEVQFSDVPTRLETLLVDRLFYFRGTPLQLRLAQTLAKRAIDDPKYFKGSGWYEVALVLLEAGDEKGAEQLLHVTGKRAMTLAGLQAEAALRRGDYKAAAAIFGTYDWVLKSKSASGVARSKPNALVPVMDGLFHQNIAELELASLSEELDRAGFPQSAELAALASLERFESKGYGRNRKAQMLARMGKFDAARSLVAEATLHPERMDPGHFRVGIATGAALAGNTDEVERAINEAPADQRDPILIKTLASLGPRSSSVRTWLEKRLELRLAQESRLNVSPDALRIFAEAGLRPAIFTTLLSRHPPSRTSAALAMRAGNAAIGRGHAGTALAIAEAAERLVPRGPEGDAELVELSDLYWKLGLTDKANSSAMRVSHPVGRVDAFSRAFNPTRGESRQKWSFELL